MRFRPCAPSVLRPASNNQVQSRPVTERRLALAILLLVTAAVVVPFTLLSSVARISGAFLFWTLFAVIVIVLIVRATAGWKAER